MKYNIAVIMGGFTDEYAISIQSGQEVVKHLSDILYNVFPIVIDDQSWYYKTEGGRKIHLNRGDFSLKIDNHKVHFDLVFNTIHGSPGEDGQLQAYFSLIGIPHTSSSFYASSLTFNKKDTLAVLRYHGIKVADSFYLEKKDFILEKEIIDKVSIPCFVKPNKSGSSLGISKVSHTSELLPAIKKAFSIDNQVLIEKALEGMEVSVGIITYKGQTKILPITEIIPSPKNTFFDYDAKYNGKSQEITPAQISSTLVKKIEKTTLLIYRLLGVKGLARSEFIIVEGVPYFLEINTTPGLTVSSLLPQQLKCEGILLSELFNDMVSQSLKK